MIYFDNAATSYQKPEEVFNSVYTTMKKYGANAGRGGHKLSVSAGEIIYETREKLSDLFGILNPLRLAFCQNTTMALNMGIKGVVRPGDHVIITSMEHNSVLRPVETLARRGIITYTVVRANNRGELSCKDIEVAIRYNTRLVVMTHASNVCGNVYDIYGVAEMLRKKDILFMVDAAQSAGVFDIDANFVDLLAFPGHKGLMGPQGTGGLYVRDGIDLSTIIEGGTGSLSEMYYQPDEFPDRLESGTQNVAALAGLLEGVKFVLREGTRAIREKETELLRHFKSEILNISNICIYGTDNVKNQSGTLALNISGMDCVEVASKLNDEYNIAVRAGLHCAVLAHESLGTKETGSVRFSFGYFNTKSEVDRAVYALYKIANNDKFNVLYTKNTQFCAW